MTGLHAYGIVSVARRKGMTLLAIAKRVGCTTDTIQKWKLGRVQRVNAAIAANLGALLEEVRGGSNE